MKKVRYFKLPPQSKALDYLERSAEQVVSSAVAEVLVARGLVEIIEDIPDPPGRKVPRTPEQRVRDRWPA